MASSSKAKKSVKPLPNDLRSVVRSGIAITSVSQCVEELVYNAIDAGSETIRIGVNIDQFNVRVEDDGQGLNEADLEAVGERYMTSKCQSLEDLQRLKYYGFRGEALASIVHVSSTVDIITRPKDMAGIELKKKFEEGKASGFVEKYNTKNVKSGTVIVIGRLLSKLPVRQQRIDKSIQLEEVKTCLEKIALINPNLRIELRNEKLGTQMLDFKTSNSYSEAFDSLFKSRVGFEANFIEEHFLYKTLFFHLYISKQFQKTKSYQFVYVNNRFIQRNRIYKWTARGVLGDENEKQDGNQAKRDKYPVFILTIACPFKEYDVTLEPKKQLIEFKAWEDVQKGIEGLTSKLKITNSFGISTNSRTAASSGVKNVSYSSSYNMQGALHSNVVRREDTSNALSKGNGSGSDPGSLGKSSTSDRTSSSIRRNLTRTTHNRHVVDVRAIRRKRKLQTQNPPPKMPHGIGNKPLLTGKVFEKFKEWKGVLGKNNNKPEEESYAKRFKPAEEVHKVSAAAEKGVFTSAAAVPPVNRSSSYAAAIISPSANSEFRWKINRYFDNMDPSDESTHEHSRSTAAASNEQGDQTTSLIRPASASQASVVNSLDGLSDTVSTFHIQDARKFESTILSKTDEHLKSWVEEEWKLPTCRETILKQIIEYWSFVSSKDRVRKVPKKSRSSKPIQTKTLSSSEQKEANQNQCCKRQSNASDVDRAAKVQLFTLCEPKLTTPESNSKNPNQSDNLDFNFKVPAPAPSHGAIVPPPLSLFPCQKSHVAPWNDKMLSGDYNESDPDLFPEFDDWSVEIVMDENQQEWLQTKDETGRKVFINLTTGNSSYDMKHVFECVKVTSEEMKKCNPARYNWLRRHFPKGFHQFLNSREREIKTQGDLTKVDGSIIKESLLNCLQDQKLLNSKWKYTELQDASKYFEGINKAASVAFGINSNVKLADIQCWKTLTNGTSSLRFSGEDFTHVQVIGQLDKKFILVGNRKSCTEDVSLNIFDQHAVHERIRLEKFISEAHGSSKNGKKYLRISEIVPPYPVNLPESEVRAMQNHKDIFCQAGLRFDPVSSVCVKITAAPRCFGEKMGSKTLTSRDMTAAFQTRIHNLIREVSHHIMSTKGANLVVLPKTIHDVLCSQACHGAIKFGDVLDKDKCSELISELIKCKSMFQCAHGRPSVTPLIRAEDLQKVSEGVPMMNHSTTASVAENHVALPSDDQYVSYFCDVSGKSDDDKYVSSGYFSVHEENASVSNSISDNQGKVENSPKQSQSEFDIDAFDPMSMFRGGDDNDKPSDNNDGQDVFDSPYFF